jgi:hypothetical protein
MSRIFSFLLFSLFVAGSALADDSIIVGVNYFAGWWKPLPNKWIGPDGQDWRPKYPGRLPLLGEYNEQETMDKEIAVASQYGVDFFLILWYFNGIDNVSERGESNARFLNVGIEQFRKSPNADKMKFAIEYCNHSPFEIKEQADWDWAVKCWVDAVQHPSYLRIEGRPLFKVHSWHHYWFENGENMEQCVKRLEQLRKTARDAGLGELLIGSGIGSYQKIPAGDWVAHVFNFTATYMDVPRDLPPPEGGKTYHPFESLAAFMRDSRKIHGEDTIPYLPYFGLNFNAEPWGDKRAKFEFPTREQLKAEWKLLKSDLENPALNLGVPLGNGKRQKIFTLYAWNEYGEGGFLAPTVEEKMMKLEVLKEVFK